MVNYWRILTRSKQVLLTLMVVLVLGALTLLVHPVRRAVRVSAQTAQAHFSSPADAPFPTINSDMLGPTQRRIVLIVRAEYAKRPVSYDAMVLKYTQGSKEAWCADFASWVMFKADQPFSNPNSDSWRIPGVYTLKDYFMSKHAYQPVGSYQPKAGDIAIYSHGQGHAAIVLSRQGSTITTIGGNESGRLRIDTRPETGSQSYNLIGYGVLSD